MSLSVCKFYSLNQTCRFGKNCRYSHSSQRPPPDLNSYNTKSKDEESIRSSCTTPAHQPFPETLKPSYIQDDEVPLSRDLTERASFEQTHSSAPTSIKKNAGNKHPVVSSDQTKGQTSPNICRHFVKHGHCYYGRNCRFVHSTLHDNALHKKGHDRGRPFSGPAGRHVPPRFRTEESAMRQPDSGVTNTDDLSNVENLEENGKPKAPISSQDPQSRQPKPAERKGKICPFYLERRCNRGRNCRFVHPRGPSSVDQRDHSHKEERENSNDAKTSNQQPGKDRQNAKNAAPNIYRRPVGMVRQIFTFAELEEIGLGEVRAGEIQSIKKRYPKDKITVISECDQLFCAKIAFTPSDPDWPFDVKVFELKVTLPGNYPEQTLSVKLPSEQDMPETVRRYVEITISEWLQDRENIMKKKGKAELVFRPFLRWLDRNLEEVTTEALKQLKRELVAKAAGMEFLSPAQLQAKLKAEASDSGEEEEADNSEDDDFSSSEGDDFDDDSDESEEEEEGQSIRLSLDPEKKGTQMELRHLQLKENASSLLLDRLKLVVQCSRCKNHADLIVPQTKVMSLSCFKCNQNQFVHYRAALAHQFSSVVGYLDLDGCQAFDLVLQDCRAVITCLGCSKLTRVDGLSSGHMVDGWCQACNAKFKLATEAVKFTQLAPSGVDTANHKKVEVTKTRRPPKDPSIREGYPLPEFGTCKHYKHSYRWLRFPCCGKAYPCDICHDKKEDHEFVFATRMICGHCCKEQNYSASRPCNGCLQHMTKIRSAHWEGGKGCRDKISMSKSDQQKYKNMNKTISNHKKATQSGGKKKTKLRHT